MLLDESECWKLVKEMDEKKKHCRNVFSWWSQDKECRIINVMKVLQKNL
jgi:hypothetical protein